MADGTTDAGHRFTRAIARIPPRSAVDGLRARDRGAPDHALMLRDHAAYLAALREAGVAVTLLPPLEAFPDSHFVEDTALCLPGLAVLMRPGAPSRAGEVAAIAPEIARHFDEVLAVEGPGHVEGGDVLWTGREVLVGRSARTDAAGIAALAAILGPRGHAVREVETPADVLHFKTECGLLDGGTILATGRLAASGCLDGYRVIEVAAGEEPCANAVRVNGLVLVSAGFPRTARRLREAGHDLREIGNAECAKIDGGMSCLSLRF